MQRISLSCLLHRSRPRRRLPSLRPSLSCRHLLEHPMCRLRQHLPPHHCVRLPTRLMPPLPRGMRHRRHHLPRRHSPHRLPLCSAVQPRKGDEQSTACTTLRHHHHRHPCLYLQLKLSYRLSRLLRLLCLQPLPLRHQSMM